MADEEEILLQGKSIAGLRVVDLKKECDKRGLSKAGSKSQLIERLKAQLLLEKLQQQPINESDEAPNSKLKEEGVTGNNAFIKQYLEKQQKLLVVEREARKRFSEEESESSQDERPGDSPKKMPTREPSIPEESTLPEPPSKKHQISAPLPVSPTQRAPPPPPTPPPPHAQMADGAGDSETGKRTRRRSSLNEEEMAEPKEGVEERIPRKSRRWRREPEVKEPEPERSPRTRRQSSQEVKEAVEEKVTSETEKKQEEKVQEVVAVEEINSKSESQVSSSQMVEITSDHQKEEKIIKTEHDKSNRAPAAPEAMEVEQSEAASEEKQQENVTESIKDTKSLQKEIEVVEKIPKVEVVEKIPKEEKVVPEKHADDVREKPHNGKEKSRSRSSSSSSSSSSRSRSKSAEKRKRSRSSSHSKSRSRSRTPKKSAASKISRKHSSSSSSSSSRSRSRSSSESDTSASPSKQKGRSPSPKLKQKPRSPSPSKPKQTARLTSPPKVQERRRSSASPPPKPKEKSPRRSNDSSSLSPQRSRQKTKSASRSSSSSSSSGSDRSRSRSKSPEKSDHSPPNSPQTSSPAKATQGSKKAEEEQMDVETPVEKKEEVTADHADTLIVTEDTSEKALDHKEEVREQSASQDINPKKISLAGRESRDKEEEKGDDAEKENKKEKPVRKRKWGSARSSTDTKPVKRISNINISTDSLKELIPDIKMTEPVLDLGNDDERISDQEEDQRDVVKIRRTVVMKDQEEETEEKKEEEDDEGITVKMEVQQEKEEESGSSAEEEEREQTTVTPKKDITPVKEPKIIRRISQPVPLQEIDEPIAPQRSQSPARNPVSKIIHVRNLVRPFTLNQLKDLLRRTGNIVENEFWIDKIKSHCFVTYETEENAVQTRKALHTTKWPSSNPKLLWLEFASPEEIEFNKQKEQGPKVAVRRDSQQEMKEKREKEREKREKEAQKKRDEPKPPPIREWDRDKIRQSRERELGPTGKKRSMSPSPGRPRRGRERSRDKERKEKKVVPDKKVEDEPPAKLLDDLFKKTKTTPCIYWLPLTDAQAELREKERLERVALREKIRARESPGDNRPPMRERGNRPDRPDLDRRRPPSPYRRPSPPRRGGPEQDSFRDRSGPRRPDRGGPPRGGPRSRSKSPRRRR